MDLFRLSGAWYEVVSYKPRHDGLTSLMCLNTRSLYEYNPDRDEVDVMLQCRRLDGKLSSVKAVMTCPPPQKMAPDVCSVRFPGAPYVPPTPFVMREVDYESYSVVEGFDGSYAQVFSRYARPGRRFINQAIEKLVKLGYDPENIHETAVTQGEP